VCELLAIVDEMHLEGLAMKRARIQREHPLFDVEAVEQALGEWINDRPMDAPGRVRLM
jgi:hypothetical protein